MFIGDSKSFAFLAKAKEISLVFIAICITSSSHNANIPRILPRALDLGPLWLAGKYVHTIRSIICK